MIDLSLHKGIQRCEKPLSSRSGNPTATKPRFSGRCGTPAMAVAKMCNPQKRPHDASGYIRSTSKRSHASPQLMLSSPCSTSSQLKSRDLNSQHQSVLNSYVTFGPSKARHNGRAASIVSHRERLQSACGSSRCQATSSFCRGVG